MTYKAFQDYYNEYSIKHLLLYLHDDMLMSPPFATELCKDYSTIKLFTKQKIYNIDLDIPPATSKTNAVGSVGDSSWLIPYGIWDNFNIAVKLTEATPEYINIDKKGKGQFYSVASNGSSACSFPLGYEDTSYIIYIDDKGLRTIDYHSDNTKCHMGTVYCNGKFYSMPRGDEPNYNYMLSYDGITLEKYEVPVNPGITRKFTDSIVVGNKIYSLPFGETSGLNEIVEFDTNSNHFDLHPLNTDDFAKKYNSQVLLNNKIIGLPYGDEHFDNSNQGIIFDTETKESKSFTINQSFGGKYRYRSGIAHKGFAYFIPAGSPNCPIYKINEQGIQLSKQYVNLLFGRPIIFNEKIYCIVQNLKQNTSYVVSINDQLDLVEEFKL